MIMNRQILFLLFLIINGSIVAQNTYDNFKKYSKAELTEDLLFLKIKLVEAHPGLYWYSSESDFTEAYQEIEKSLNDNMSELQFLKLVGKLNNTIKCVHSDIRPSSNYNSFWKDSVKLIPLNIRKVKSGFIVAQNLSEHIELRFGTKIISINNTPIGEIIAQLLPYIPSDGDNLTRKYDALKRGFYRYYSYYINATSESFKLVYENENGKRLSIVVDGIKKKIFDERRISLRNLSNQSPPISSQYIDSNSTAILKVSSFRHDLMEKSDINFENYITDFFKQLKNRKTEHLIIDLRDNGGGYSEYGAILYSFLSDTSFQYCKNQIVTTNKSIEGIEYDIPETFQGFPKGIAFENGQYKWPLHSVLGWRKPSDFNFSGKVYFLINGGCASTTSEFASLARSNELGIFVGEEVGGCYAGNSGGVLGWIELPNTKLKVRIAMVKYEITMTKSINKQGVIPDFEIEYSELDITEGKDLEMEYVMKKIKN